MRVVVVWDTDTTTERVRCLHTAKKNHIPKATSCCCCGVCIWDVEGMHNARQVRQCDASTQTSR